MKIQTAFRLEKDLLEILKEKASSQKRSLNNYVEYILFKSVGDIPNADTIEAINEAHDNKNLKPIKDLDSFLESL
ncbi:hypothetical protein [Aestuariivivens insulae]|uniref:hypothetical protein n=1 Tax=Aestuariivivens insulae TaxID=1621988 RepID=UPI001F57B7B9|nr:hypothetical protein [Aestuariivivens insulae]